MNKNAGTGAKLGNLFKSLSKKQKNIGLFATELVLIAAVSVVSVAGVNLSGGSAVTNSSSSKSSAQNSAGSSSDLSAAGLSSQPGTDSAVSSDSIGTIDNTVANQMTTITTSSKFNMQTWNSSRFLPALKNAAPVLDYINTNGMSNDELLTFTTLKGIVNKKQPRIYTTDSDPATSNDSGWIAKLNLKLNKVSSAYSLITKYKSEIKGMIIYDNSSPLLASTINLATTMAGLDNAIVVSPQMASKLKSYNIPVIADLRGKFRNQWEVYQYEFDNFAKKTTNRVLVELPPNVYGFVRDYAIAIGASVVYLDPSISKDVDLLTSYIGRMSSGKGVILGWWPSEQPGVNFASSFGIPTVASDYSVNLSVYAGMPTKVAKPKAAPSITLSNKIYIAMVVSDGDNAQYTEGKMLSMWNQPERGSFPLSWTITPSMMDVETPLLNYYYKTATANDCFISGPSAYGYFYPKSWRDKSTLASFLKLSNNYMSAMGLKAITVWDPLPGAMGDDYMKIYADNVPSMLGLTQQETMAKPVELFNNKFLALQMDGAYCSEVKQMENVLSDKVNSFNGTKPVFGVIQGEPWDELGKLNNFAKIVDYYKALNPNVEFVRLDQLMQLETQYLKQGK